MLDFQLELLSGIFATSQRKSPYEEIGKLLNIWWLMQVCSPQKNPFTLLKTVSVIKKTLKVFGCYLCLIHMLKTMYLN